MYSCQWANDQRITRRQQSVYTPYREYALRKVLKRNAPGLPNIDMHEWLANSIPDNIPYYIGGWNKGQRHGQGSMIYSDDTMYSCQWKNDQWKYDQWNNDRQDYIPNRGQWSDYTPYREHALRKVLKRNTPGLPDIDMHGWLANSIPDTSAQMCYNDHGQEILHVNDVNGPRPPRNVARDDDDHKIDVA